MESGPFGLNDNDFWADPWKTFDDVALDRVANCREGVIIDTPDDVDIDARTTLPMISYYTADLGLLQRFPFEGNALITLMDTDNNQLLCSRVEPREPVAAPKKEVSPGFGGTDCIIDLKGSSGMPWRSGNYIATVIMRDQVSNRKEIALGRSPGAYRDPEAEKLLVEERRKRPPRMIKPPVENDLIGFRKTAESPELPEGQGIVVHVARAILKENKAGNMLHAGLRVAIPPHDIVRVVDGDKPVDVGDPDATAVIGATLVIVGSEISSPITLPLAIPSYLELDGTAGEPVASGYFSLDLFKIEQIANTAQTYFIYVFAGAEMTGPILSAAVDAET